ncbi:hypothetical protein NVP2275O_070 [Vibrio phage 2.275.O._10N.286.54.E11]|nr:hypothetical protein NVP2275O_070 [Vibrio phage 2.275.O._10N.286.54.E11]
MKHINESSARPNILKNLILPLISIDQYEPKIQEDSIVVVFEVIGNYDAAYDLSSFVEKLPETTLDTEAREIPNMSGNYEVFCEFERNSDFPDIFMKVISDVQKLGNIQNWNIDVHGKKSVEPLTINNLKKMVRLVKKKPLREFMDCSGVSVNFLDEGFNLKNNILQQEITVDQECYFVNEDTVHLMIQKYGLTEAHRVRQSMFPMHDVCQFVGTNTYLLERDGVYLVIN